MTTMIPAFVCGCGNKIDAATVPPGVEPPGVGDFAVCARCGEIRQFGPGLTLVPADLSSISPENRAELLARQREVRSGFARRVRATLIENVEGECCACRTERMFAPEYRTRPVRPAEYPFALAWILGAAHMLYEASQGSPVTHFTFCKIHGEDFAEVAGRLGLQVPILRRPRNENAS